MRGTVNTFFRGSIPLDAYINYCFGLGYLGPVVRTALDFRFRVLPAIITNLKISLKEVIVKLINK